MSCEYEVGHPTHREILRVDKRVDSIPDNRRSKCKDLEASEALYV